MVTRKVRFVIKRRREEVLVSLNSLVHRREQLRIHYRLIFLLKGWHQLERHHHEHHHLIYLHSSFTMVKVCAVVILLGVVAAVQGKIHAPESFLPRLLDDAEEACNCSEGSPCSECQKCDCDSDAEVSLITMYMLKDSIIEQS